MSLLWHHVRRIFWLNFNKPHRKISILAKDGLQILPPKSKRRQLLLVRTNYKSSTSRPFLATAHKSCSAALISSTTRHPLTSRHLRWFHTTPRRQIPPVFWVVLKPLGKIWAMFWGRYVLLLRFTSYLFSYLSYMSEVDILALMWPLHSDAYSSQLLLHFSSCCFELFFR